MAFIYEVTQSQPWLNTIDTPQIQNNIDEIASYYNGYMTIEAICGLVGNMRRESYLNPGQIEAGSGGGHGLIQWTPGSALINYVSGNWYDGIEQLDLIKREGEGEVSGRWLPTRQYPQSWEEYCQLTDVELATRVYCANRERAGVVAMEQRIQYANECYEYLQHHPPHPPTPTIDRFVAVLMNKRFLKKMRKFR